LVTQGFCEKHATRDGDSDRFRGSAASRGYDATWQRFRRSYLEHHPLCLDCLDRKEVAVATELHHLVKLRDAPERRLDPSNVRPLCSTCHKVRTARGE